MNREEIEYWLKSFSNNKQSYMSKDGKIITLFKVFRELKELHLLLKIKNDYIKELEGYKHNLDRDYLRLEKENQELKKQLEKTNTTLDTHNELIEYMKNQQKEFINFLENEKDRCLTFYSSTECMYAYDVFKDVLSKYKEIIG